MAQAGTAWVKFLGDFTNLAAGSEKAISGMAGKWKSMSKSLLGPALAVGVTAGLTKLGADFHKAYATIRTGTGETGKALRGLEGDFKAVLKTRPDSMNKVADALTAVHQRLGITGPALQDTTRTFLRLSAVTGKEVAPAIEAMTRVMGDWGRPASQATRTMDELFRAGQKTGVGFDQIAEGMTRFGAPLRQMGFSFEQSAAMVGKFQKEGVNTQLVMGSLRIALGKFAKAGKDPVTALQSITDQIKNAGSAGEANKLALQTFGARAGPDMAAAIREGRFELGGLVKDIQSGGDTIAKSAQDTATFSGKWKIFKNQMAVALEPIGTKLFDSLTTALTALAPVLATTAAGFGTLASNMDIVIPVLATLTAMVATGKLVSGIKAIVGMFSEEAAAGIAAGWPVLIVGAIVAVGVALFIAYKKVKWFHDAVDAMWQGIQTAARFVSRNWQAFAIGLAVVLGPITALAAGFVALYTKVDWFRRAVDSLVRSLIPLAKAFMGVGLAVGRYLLEPFRTAFNVIVKLIHGDWRGALKELVSLPLRMLKQYAAIWRKFGTLAWEGIKLLGKAVVTLGPVVLRALGSVALGIVRWAGGLGGKLARAAGGLAEAFAGWIGRATVGVLAALGRLTVSILEWIATTIPKVGIAMLRFLPVMLGWIVEAAVKLPLYLVSFVVQILSWTVMAQAQIAKAFLRFGAAALGWIVDTVAKLPGQLWRLWVTIDTWLISTATSLGKAFLAFVPKALSWIWGVLQQLPGQLARVALGIFQWVGSTERSIAAWVIGLARSFMGWVGRVLTALPGQLARIGSTIWDALIKLPGLIYKAEVAIFKAFTHMGSGIFNAIVGGIKAAAKVVGDVAATIGKAVIGFVRDHVFRPLADWGISVLGHKVKPFSGILQKIGALAAGGLITKPQLMMVGEAGPELVLPLNDPARVAALLAAYAPQIATPGAGAGATPGKAAEPTGINAWADAVVARLAALPAQIIAATQPLILWERWMVALFGRLLATVTNFAVRAGLTLRLFATQAGATISAFAAQTLAVLVLWTARVTSMLRASVATWASLGKAAGTAYVQALTGKLNGATTSIVRIVDGYARKLAAGLNPILKATGNKPITFGKGGIATYARGGLENHVAQIAPAGALRIWAEPETGGEAYIPLAASNRARSKAITEAVVRRFGGDVHWYKAGAVTGDAHGLNPAFLSRVTSWANAVGDTFHITSGYRDVARQAALYSKYLRGEGNLAARPGSSMHNYGLAIDGPHWGGRNPAAFGLVYRVPGEPWHVEPVEARAWRGLAPAAGWGDYPGVARASLPPVPPLGHSGWLYDVADKAMKYTLAQSTTWASAALATAAAGAPDVTGGALTSGSAVQIGRQMAAARGWTGSVFDALNKLWTRESGWRVNADNPSSSAYGIPQALPGSKMASAGADWRTNPATQIAWGLGYIASTYGNPLAAWAHSQRFNWYGRGGLAFVHGPSFDRGGTLRPGLNLVRNDTGANEPLVPARGAAVQITEAHFHDAVDYDAFLQRTSWAVRAGRL